MQINDAAPAQPAPPVAKDEARGGGDEPAQRDRSRAGRRFRDALDRGRRGSTDGDGASDGAACAAAMAGWFRSEALHAAAIPAAGKTATGAAAVTGARPVDRVLIGSGPDGAQARIRIGAGALAGTEIQLSAGAAGHAVEARLLTQAAGSRQTLSVVMDEIRSRLRDRGIVLAMQGPPARGPAAARELDAGVGEPARPAADASAGTRR